MGVVPQDTVLFNDTLGYNIGYVLLRPFSLSLAPLSPSYVAFSCHV